VLVVGGGYIGVEFAGIFRGLGAEVALAHRRGRLLSGFDGDLREAVTEGVTASGVALHAGCTLVAVEQTGRGLRASLSNGARLDVDCVLCAVGRVPNTADLGLDAARVMTDDVGAVTVDEYGRTTVSHVFAVGDCTDRITLTPVALAEGQAVARTIFGDGPVRPDHENVPTAVFGQPPLATVGLSEDAARSEGRDVDVYRSTFRPLKQTLGARARRSLVKIVVERGTGRVLGFHMVGPDAPEIVQGFAVALRVGVTKAQLDATIGIHPTSAEEFVTLRTRA
jgi:glutathione reductase (NADPH)